MKLHPPFKIGSRLLPCLDIGGAEVSLEHVKTNAEGRDVYRWYVDLPRTGRNQRRARREFSAADLKTGCQRGGYQEMFGALLAFLGAAADSLAWCERQGRKIGPDDNASMFPLPVVRWAAENSDTIEMLREEIEGGEDSSFGPRRTLIEE